MLSKRESLAAEDLRPEVGADRVVDARRRGPRRRSAARDQRQIESGEPASAAQRADREEQRVAGQERRDDQPGLAEHDQEQQHVEPRAERLRPDRPGARRGAGRRRSRCGWLPRWPPQSRSRVADRRLSCRPPLRTEAAMSYFAFQPLFELGARRRRPYRKLDGDLGRHRHVPRRARSCTVDAGGAHAPRRRGGPRRLAPLPARATWRSCARSSTTPRRRRTTASSRSNMLRNANIVGRHGAAVAARTPAPRS